MIVCSAVFESATNFLTTVITVLLIFDYHVIKQNTTGGSRWIKLPPHPRSAFFYEVERTVLFKQSEEFGINVTHEV